MKFEYLIVRSYDGMNEESLNIFGRAGWELVTAIIKPTGEDDPLRIVYYFKRPVQ